MKNNWPLPEKKEQNCNRHVEAIKKLTEHVHRSRILILFALISVAVCGVYFYLKFTENNTKSVEEHKSATLKTNKNIPPKAALPKSRPAHKKPTKNISKNAVAAKKEPIVVSTVTNSSGAVIQDLIMPDGKTKRTIKPPRQVWDNAANQLIAFAVSMKPGEDAAPLPSGVSDEEFIKAMKKDIVILDDDPQEVRELKRTVREIRKDILKMMVETGKGFEEILNEHRDMVNDNTQFYREALKGVSEVAADGTAEDVEEYIKRANELLKQRGARELSPSSARGRRRGRR